jgi:hypothetical protein
LLIDDNDVYDDEYHDRGFIAIVIIIVLITQYAKDAKFSVCAANAQRTAAFMAQQYVM